MIHTVGICQHPHRADASVIEDVEIFQRGLVAGLHPADSGGHGVHVTGGMPQGRPGVTDGLEHRQDAVFIVAVGGQRLAHGRQVIVEEGRCVGHLHQIRQILLCLVLTLEEGGKGDLIGFPGRCQCAAGGQRGGLLVQLPLHGILHIALKGVVLFAPVLDTARRHSNKPARCRANSRANGAAKHEASGSPGRSGR